jgi:hypothetical protein
MIEIDSNDFFSFPFLLLVFFGPVLHDFPFVVPLPPVCSEPVYDSYNIEIRIKH